jgi:hypothetical protein
MSSRMRWLFALAAVAVALGLATRTFLRMDLDELRLLTADHPVQNPKDGYTSSSECRACHAGQFESWHASYHRTMTQRPSPASVKGDFTATLTLDGQRIGLRRDGERYLVDMPRPAWWAGPASAVRIERPVELVTGSHNYQVYWMSTGNSTVLAQLPFVWLTHEGRWSPRRSAFIAPPGELGDEYGRWNTVCIRCHTTGGRPGADLEKNVMRSAVSEFGIACEACHGPGGAHVAAMRDPVRRYTAHLGAGGDAGMTNPRKLAAERASQICAQCHSINVPDAEERGHWMKSGFTYRPGEDLAATRRIATGRGADLDPGYFWPDGVVRVTGREFHGLRASPCFKGGDFSCLSCHALHKPENDPRSLDVWRNAQLRHFDDRNGQCLQCHEAMRDSGKLSAHTRHGAASSGSECVNCHMPNTIYGLGKGTRNHQITNPNVATDAATGRPNACNLCHVDRTLDWSATYLQKWTGKPRPSLSQEQRTVPASLLHLYKGDAAQRALAVHSLGWAPARALVGENWALPHLVQAVDDRYEVIGLVAYRALRQFPAGKKLTPDFLDLPPEKRRPAVEQVIGAMPAKDAPRAARNERPMLLKE